jgi:hypothetical protein
MAKIVTEFSFQIDDHPGVLSSLSDILGKAGVNIDGGVGVAGAGRATIKFVIYKAEAAVKALKNSGINYDTREVIEIKVKDRPGELAKVASALSEAGINITLFYLTIHQTLVIDVNNHQAASKVLELLGY